MALRTKIRQLIIPRKTQDPVAQPDYSIDQRTIEQWAMQVLKYLQDNGILEITSTGGTVTITNPFGPVTNLEATGGGGGGITDITSTGGTIDVTNPFGPVTNVEVDGVPFLPYKDANDNVGYGFHSFGAITTGADNAAFGRNAGHGITTGNSNVMVGFSAGQGITTGNENVSIGEGTGPHTACIENTAVGYQALQNITTGGTNTAVGWTAGPQNDHKFTTCLGAATSCDLFADGSVVIGIDHAGNAAFSHNQDDFVLGVANHVMVFQNHTTGGTTTNLGTNSPAVTATPAGWIRMRGSNANGSTIGYIPFWQ
jgi:hypothetical protein